MPPEGRHGASTSVPVRSALAAAEQAAAELDQVADTELAVAILIQHRTEQTAEPGLLHGLLAFLPELPAERAGIQPLRAGVPGQERHDDRGEQGEQLPGLRTVQSGGLAEAAGRLALLAA